MPEPKDLLDSENPTPTPTPTPEPYKPIYVNPEVQANPIQQPPTYYVPFAGRGPKQPFKGPSWARLQSMLAHGPANNVPDPAKNLTYWEYPATVARYHNLIRTAPPGWQPPDWLKVDEINFAYDYLKFRNGDTPWQEWKALNPADPGVQVLQSIAMPPFEALWDTEKAKAQNSLLLPGQLEEKQPIDWSEMPLWQQIELGMTTPNTSYISDRPEWTRLTAAGGQSLLMGIGVGMGATLLTANPVVGVIAALVATGGMTYQAMTGNKVPIINEFILASNVLSEGLERIWGVQKQIKVDGLEEVMDEFPAAWRAANLSNETAKINTSNAFVDFNNAVLVPLGLADKDTKAGANQVWRFESGETEPVTLSGTGLTGKKGAEELSVVREWINNGTAQAAFDRATIDGSFAGTFQEYIYSTIQPEYGITGVVNDLVAQTIFDPLNFVPGTIGKVGELTTKSIASKSTNPATVRAAGDLSAVFKQGQGSILIDALPFGLQQIVSGITKTPGSKGIIDTFNAYRDTIRTGYHPSQLRGASPDMTAKYNSLIKAGVGMHDIHILGDTITWKRPDTGQMDTFQGKKGTDFVIPTVEELSPFEKWVGGIDDTYGLKELRPTVGKTFAQKLSLLTPETQAIAMINIFHGNMSALMDAAGGKADAMIGLIQKLADPSKVKPGDVGESIIKSPAARAVQGAMQYAMKDGDLAANMLASWESGAVRRGMLDKIADALGEKPADVLTQLKENPDAMAGRLNKIAPELKTTPEALTETLKVFMGDDALPWNIEQFQTQVLTTFADKMDAYFVDKYGLKPESWVFRVSNAMKGVQSLVLLGFNPAYFMNNWINNVVTRAVDGVGGHMTAKQINDFNVRLGIFPKDSGLTGFDEITGAIHNKVVGAQNDMLGKAQKAVKIVNKVGVFSRLSGWMEKAEGNQARAIATMQFLDKTKKAGVGIRKMSLGLEHALDTNYPGMKEKVYSAINAGLNMKEIEASLFKTVQQPHVESIIDMIDAKYTPDMPGVSRELLRKMGIIDRLNDALKNATDNDGVEKAFADVETNFNDWIEKNHIESIKNQAEEAKNAVQAERIPYVLQKTGDMAIENGQNWINSRADWDRLYSQLDNGVITKGQFNKLASELQAKHSAEMQRFNEYQLQVQKGMIEGLGIETEHTRGFVTGMADMNAVWKQFWQDSNKLKRDYFSQGENKSITWDDVVSRTEDLYIKATQAEKVIQQKMDGVFANMYSDYTGWDVTKATQWRAALIGMRDNIVKAQQDMRIKTREMSAVEKALEYSVFNQKYNRMIADMKQFEHDGAFELMNKPVPEAVIDIPEVKNPAIDAVRNEENRAMMRNQGYADADINELVPAGEVQPMPMGDDMAAQVMNVEPGSPADLAFKDAQGKVIAERLTEVTRAKMVAEDIINQADKVKREKLIHQEGYIARSDVETQVRESFKNSTNSEIGAAMLLMDEHANMLAKRSGLTPTDATRDAWYATHLDEIKTGIIDEATRANLIQKGKAEPKGGTTFGADGRAVVRAFKSHDISTLFHEIGHIFLRDLSDAQLDVVAKLGGLKDAAEYRLLEQKFRSGELKEGTPDYKRYVQAEEAAVRGWERYLTEGDAPTPALRSVFKQFTNWMLNIYKKLFKQNGRVEGFEGTELNVDLNQMIDGISLRDIFDRMLTDEPNRPKTFDQLVSDRAASLKNEGRNWRFTPEELTAMAQKEITANILDGWNNPDEARASLDSMTDYKVLKDGTQVDDTVIHDALNHIEQNAASNPWNVKAPQVEGTRTTARGISDPTMEFEFQFKVIDLDDIQASDMWVGDALKPNPNFMQELQPRNRSEKQGVTQVESIARDLIPDELLFDSKDIQRGAPVVGSDGMIESGNGRALAMKRAAEMYPLKWQAYQEALKVQAAQYGIDPASIEGMKNPVLVRERTTAMTPEERVAFVNDANKPIAAAMNPGEIALNDAVKITDPMLRILDVLDTEDIFTALSSPRNSKFVNRFLEQLAPTERTAISTDGMINQSGINRIVNALFAKVYPGVEGERMINTFIQSLDSNVKTLQSAVMASLPQVAVSEGLIKSGMRPAELSIANDIAKTVDMVSNIRHNGLSAEEYLGQMNLFGENPKDAMTPVQAAMLVLFDQKKPAKIREFLRNYARLVEAEPAVGQGSVADLVRTKLEVVNDALTNANQPGLFGTDAGAGTAGSTASLAASLPDNQLAKPNAGTDNGVGAIPDGSEGLPRLVEQEVIPGAGDIARDARTNESRSDYESGKLVPIEKAETIDLAHSDVLPVSPEVQAILAKADAYKFANKEAANAYLQWVIDGEKGTVPAGVNNKIVMDFMGDLDVLREYSVNKTSGVPIADSSILPGITVQKVFAFTHGDTPVIANVYKDGKLIAYLPEMKLTDARIDDSSRILGLDPQFPDRIVYEQDGVIKSVDSKKPKVDKAGQNELFQSVMNIDELIKEYPDMKVELFEKDKTIQLVKVVLPKDARGQGRGTAFMESLLEYADNKGKTITLTPSTSYGASSVGRLIDFYKRFGFIENRGKRADFEISDSMYRSPNTQNTLFQEGIRVENATMSKEALDNYAGALVRQAEKEGDSALSDGIMYEPNKSNKIAILDAAHKINPELAERVAKTVRNELFQEGQQADWYYSQLGNVLDTMPNKITPEALRGFLNGKVKADELAWTGFDKWIGEQQGSITKQDALDFIQEHQVKVEEVVHGGNEGDVAAWWNDEGGANEDILFTELDGAERSDALMRYRDEVGDYEAEGNKFAQYALPGGENYRELLLTMPPSEPKYGNLIWKENKRHQWAWFDGEKQVSGAFLEENMRDGALRTVNTGSRVDQANYMSAHWSEPNVLAHIRFDDRVDADGKRVLFIEEIQSDWHQTGRERGYQSKIDMDKITAKYFPAEPGQDPNIYPGYWESYDQNGRMIIREAGNLTEEQVIQSAQSTWAKLKETEGVPDAPFKKNWDELAMKRAIAYAAENGYDRVAWTTGKMQADRYNLAKQVDFVGYQKNADGTYRVSANAQGRGIPLGENLTPEKLVDVIGKDVADRIIAGQGTKENWAATNEPRNEFMVLRGEKDLSVGGEGMKGFYDQKIPAIVNKYIKKWGSEVGEANINESHSQAAFDTKAEAERFIAENKGLNYVLKEEARNGGWSVRDADNGNGVVKTGAYYDTVPAFDITDAMRKSVVNEGQPLFQNAQPEPEPMNHPDAPMGKVPLNGTPAIEPFSRVLDEINSEQIRPMMDDIKLEYKKQLADKSFKWEGVADEHKKAVRKYLNNDVRTDLSGVKRAAVTYGDTMRNNAMLDYSRRYGFDAVINTVFPYQFWYTRTMMNWAKRMVDKPAWFAMYARMQKAKERMEREGMPTRLNGKIRIPMAWMPEWMGGGLWVDMSYKIFPHEQFGQPFEQYAMNRNQVFKRAEQIVSDMKAAETITITEANEAINAKKGSVWDRAVSQAEQELDKSASPASMAGMMMQPALWWQIPKQLIAGTPEKLSPLPITRTGQTIRDLGSDTFLEGATDIVGGLLAGPEELLRKGAGLSQFGQWGDYYLDRTLAGMAADGEITAETARIAMIQRNGAAFEEATRRVTREQTLRTPGATGLVAIKEGANAGQTLAAFLGGMFGGSLFSEGELKMRGLKPIYDNAWNELKAGNEDALTKFFDDYPEYSARLALYDKPEERLHQFLIDSIWRKYMELDAGNKTVVSNLLGDDFQTTFLNKETRDYEAVDDQTLAYWSQTIKKAEMPEQVADVKGQQPNYFSDPMLVKINEYKAEKDRLFPNIGNFQSMYFDLPAGAQRKNFLNMYPNLIRYWDWKDSYAVQHPEIVPYFEELSSNSTASKTSSELSSPLIRQLIEYGTGGSLSAGAKAELSRIKNQVSPELSDEEFLQIALQLVMSGS